MTVAPALHFSATYAEARQRFLAAATARGLPIEAHIHPQARGADGEDLAIDVAYMGPADAAAVLVLIAGTHGAEGFCGSGAQVAMLHDPAFIDVVAASGVRVVLLHALNPYGFSHLRRTNEDNIDLNRNFRDFATPPLPNAAYAEVHGFMVPATWPPDAAALAQMQAYIAQRGLPALQAAVSGGQCEFPDGLFYGGVRPAWSNVVLRRLLRAEASKCQRLGWIDFHTGLGPRGHGEKILAGGNVADLARAKRWWGQDVTSFVDGSSTSAPLTGVNFNAVYDECPQAEVAGIALEFGTLPVLEVFQALRADQWLSNYPAAPAATHAAIKRQVRDAFYQDADDWKAMVVEQARACALAALQALGRDDKAGSA